jgi:hypothetical protein
MSEFEQREDLLKQREKALDDREKDLESKCGIHPRLTLFQSIFTSMFIESDWYF